MSSTITALTSGGGLAMAGDTSGSLQLQTNNGTTAMTIDTSQNVGIGTSSPSAKNDVVGTIRTTSSNSPTSGAGVEIDYGSIAANTGRIFAFDRTGSARKDMAIDGANVLLYTGGSERMRMTSTGQLLIGKTVEDSVPTTGCQLTVSGVIAVTRNTSSGYVGYWNIKGGSGGVHEFYLSDVSKGTISVSSGGTAYNTTSDYRLKENIAPMQNALGVVAQLKPVTYTWKTDGSDGQGFIAHELQEVVPHCVTGEKDAVRIVDELDEGGKKIGEKTEPVYQGIDTSFLVATLTAAIQEQQTIISDLKARIETLEGAK